MKTPDRTEEIIARLGALYESDPEAFETMRRRLIEQTIEGFPEEHRARAYGLQFRLDIELSRYKDPVARMNRMVEIFWDGVRRFQEVVSDPGSALREREREKTPAEIISFPRRDRTVH